MARSPAKPPSSARADKTSSLTRLLPLATSDAAPADVNDRSAVAALDRTRRLHEEYGLDDDDDAGHGQFPAERDDADGQDWEGDPEDEEEVEEDEEPDEEAGEDYDSPLATPRSKRGLVGSSTPRSSAPGTPSHRSTTGGTPRSRAGTKGTPTMRTPRQRKPPAWMIDPSLPGFVRPTAADAYFLAAARPKRKRVEHVDEEEDEDQWEKREPSVLGTPHRSSKPANRDATIRNPEQVLSVDERRQYLQTYHRARYAEWRSLLSSGNNLIFFGHGSKREMLEEFMTTTLQPAGHCISINGLYPGLKIRDVLLEIAIAFPEVEQCPVPDGLARGIDKLAHKIYAYFLPFEAIPTADAKSHAPSFKTSRKPLFLLLHNMDGAGMKNERSLEILSLFASSPGIHLVTSFDHVHTPILFSTTLNNTPKHRYTEGGWSGIPPPSRGFNWAWIQASTYAPYTVETEYVRQSAAYSGKTLANDEQLGRHGATGDVTEEGALRILASVPPMAKRLFKLLATKQLAALSTDAPSSKTFPAATAAFAPPFAIDSDILQALAKDKFIAREEERYNTQLMEYKDHGVIVEHTIDAENRTGRWLWIPFSKESLSRIVKTLHDVEA